MTAKSLSAPAGSRRIRRTSIATLLALACAAGASTCSHEHEGTPTQAVCPTTQTLTYANFGQAFMQQYCLSCHSSSVQGAARNGAPSDHNFDKLADIRSFAEHIDMHAGSGPGGTNDAMPEDDPLPTIDERRKLSEWLACGAP